MNRRGGSSSGGSRYRNPCLTMHQPWASLLVHGIKKIEGRSWPAPLTGRLWIHAASKVPEPETIEAMENFYREIYAVDGITDIKFPEYYPVSRLLGCVEVVGCLRREELVSWEKVPQSVRLEGLTDFCWLCESPQKLLIPFEMRGYQGVYNLENRIYEAAVRGLSQIQGPLPVQFPLPAPRDSLSLKPGALLLSSSKKIETVKSKSVNAAIAGARAAATQFSKKDESRNAIREQSVRVPTVESEETAVSDYLNRATFNPQIGNIGEKNHALNTKTNLMRVGSGDGMSQQPERRISRPCGTAKLFSEALRGMNSNR